VSDPQPYAVSVAGRVHDRLLELADVAKAPGDGRAFLTALAEFHRRLRVYPEFGDPLVDLTQHDGHIRLGVVPPLTMRYAVLEDQRAEFVGARPVLLARRPGG
jgi:hypothetical protein